MTEIFLPSRMLGAGTPAMRVVHASTGAVDILPRGILGRNMPELDLLSTMGGVGPLYENYQLDDLFTQTLTIGVFDQFVITSAYTYLSSITDYLSDDYVLSDAFAHALQLAVADAFAMTDTITIRDFILALSSAYALTDSFAPQVNIAVEWLDSWVMADSLLSSMRLSVADAFAMVDSIVAVTRALLALSDAYAVSDSFADTATFVFTSSDGFGMSDAGFIARLTATLALGDAFSLVGVFSLSDAEKYLAWVVNATTRASYKFVNYPANSFATVNGKVLLCSSDGVHQIGGDTDNGEAIAGAFLRTGKMNFGTELMKRIDEAYMLYSADGDTLIKVIFSEDGNQAEAWYQMERCTANEVRASEVPVQRGIESVFYQFELRPLKGRPARYNQLTVVPMITQRMV